MKHKVLVIDDEPLMLKSTCMALNHRGFETSGTIESVKGVGAAMEYHPDIILLDIMMPGLDGWQVLDLLKAEPATASIPVIMFTAKEYSNGTALALKSGAAGFIAKPFELDDLVETLGRHLAAKEPHHD